jgi:hypothetical protein
VSVCGLIAIVKQTELPLCCVKSANTQEWRVLSDSCQICQSFILNYLFDTVPFSISLSTAWNSFVRLDCIIMEPF